MLTSERQQQIKNLLLEYRQIDVRTLCSILYVSPATVRRDLDALEKEGFLVKTYGGAILSDSASRSADAVTEATSPLDMERGEIAGYALNLIQPNDILYLGSGPLCCELAKRLPACAPLRVVTNNLSAAQHLLNQPQIKVVLLGGEIETIANYHATIGSSVTADLNKMYFSKCFFSPDGFSLRQGFSVNSTEKGTLLREASASAGESYLLTDSALYEQAALYAIGSLQPFPNVVAPITLPDEFKSYFIQQGVRLYEVHCP